MKGTARGPEKVEKNLLCEAQAWERSERGGLPLSFTLILKLPELWQHIPGPPNISINTYRNPNIARIFRTVPRHSLHHKCFAVPKPYVSSCCAFALRLPKMIQRNVLRSVDNENGCRALFLNTPSSN